MKSSNQAISPPEKRDKPDRKACLSHSEPLQFLYVLLHCFAQIPFDLQASFILLKLMQQHAVTMVMWATYLS